MILLFLIFIIDIFKKLNEIFLISIFDFELSQNYIFRLDYLKIYI